MDPLPRYITSAEDAERFAAAQMRDMGFGDAKVTAAGPDGGLDVVASRAVAQVKWMHAKVGRPDLQRLYGARGADHSRELLFFTEMLSGGPYTPQAVDYANERGIGLFAYTSDGNLFLQNQHAENLVTGIDRVRAARAARAARIAVIRQVVWAILLLGSFCGLVVSVATVRSAVGVWIALTLLCVLGLALAWLRRAGVE